MMEEDGDDKDDTKRKTRNLSEKKRRDQFNILVNELGTMVSSNNKKMDKSTVLKSTISFLRTHNEFTVRSRAHDISEEWKPSFLSNEEFTYLVMEAQEGFVMVFSATGRIYYVSESITSLLGHNPADVIHRSIFDLTYEDDRPKLYSLLQNPEPTVESSIVSESEIMFHCHLKRGGPDLRDVVSYELVQFNGHFREYIGSKLDPVENDNMSNYGEQDPRLLFVCTAKLHTPQLIRDVSLMDSSRSEFTSRHSLEWKFLFLDHRAPPIIGYLPFEVLGTSGYDYYHFDDLEKVVTCHEALMQKGEMTSCYYRFLTKGQQWIWLQTRFYITYHQWNSKPEFVVCTHRVVSYADIAKSTKQEISQPELANEPQVSQPILKDSSPEESISNVSPSYLSETSDAFVPYQALSQTASVKSASASSVTGTASTAITGVSGNASWTRSRTRYATASDTASVSGDSRCSQRNGSREADSGIYTPYNPHGYQRFEPDGQYYGQGSESGVVVYPNKFPADAGLVPQHGVGVQYLEPSPYVTTASGMVPISLPTLCSVPIIVADQAQFQEQLQQKHEELQQLIVRQQEELRHVKEQLVLARLGILPPMDNVPNSYANNEPEQQQQRVQSSATYEGSRERPPPGDYPPQNPPSSDHRPQMPQ